jgi:hypothetical protein
MKKASTLGECAELVKKKEEFMFNHLCGALNTHSDPAIPPCYAVYSYNTVIYVYDYEACQWFGNNEKHSSTTQRHIDTVKPYSVAQWTDETILSHIATQGVVNAMARRMA